MNPGKNPKRRTITKRVLRKQQERNVSSFVYETVLWGFPEIALGDGPKERHIFLLSAAYLSYAI